MNHGYFERDLPPELNDLADLAFDLRWNNGPTARHLWSRFDQELWERTENPLLVLQSAYQSQIDAAARDPKLLSELRKWRSEVQEYYDTEPEFCSLDPEHVLRKVAYFSMEFGLSESLPIYSGGLGMLAGDHLKTASDLGVPMVAVGLLYQQGYFRQVIGDEGQQLEAYPFNDPGSLPVRPLTDKDGQWVRVRLPMAGRTLFVRVWEARVGRVRLYLLDSNDSMNSPWDRGITAQLYDSARETRLLQEIVLGVGGWRLLEQLGIEIDVCHLNEGHAAFAILARAAGFAAKHNLPLRTAFTATRAGNVFTTHTPVEAAFDRFDPRRIAFYAQPFLDEVGLPVRELLAMGRKNPDDDTELFNMAWLAIHGSCHVNAVSRLHGAVSRELFGPLFPRWPREEIPVRATTNGVHVPTWASHRAALLWGEADGRHLWLDGLQHVSDRIAQTPAKELWEFRTKQRQSLLRYVSKRASDSSAISASGSARVSSPGQFFDPNILTIGFARRFATYKRANLILSDPERLKRMLMHANRPVQLIVAGKAHPNDGFGKALVQKMTKFLRQTELSGHAVFLEDYDMVLGQHMVAGVDVWLNTPLRPNEACGTSGMKVLVNGGLNVSILDGWWDEAISEDCESSNSPGWTIGTRETSTMDALAARDANSLFDVLEHQVIPEFYDRDADGIPHRWLDRVKNSMTMLTPQFSATRMLHEYVADSYLPAARAFAARAADNARLAAEIVHWRDRVRTHWSHVRFGQVRFSELPDRLTVRVECWLDDLSPDAVRVQLHTEGAGGGVPATIVDLARSHELPGSVNGYVYDGELPGHSSPDDCAIRIVPHHPDAFLPIEQHCILWSR